MDDSTLLNLYLYRCRGLSSSDGWYKSNIRVRRRILTQIVAILEAFCVENGIPLPAENAFVEMRMQVAMTLSYLPQEGGFLSTSALFGVSKATTIRKINQVCIDCIEFQFRCKGEYK